MQAKEAYQTAQAYAREGNMVKAARVLKGVDHPKCEQLLSKIQATPQYRKRRNRRRAIIGACVAIVLIFTALVMYVMLVSVPDTFDTLCATWEAQGTYSEACY